MNLEHVALLELEPLRKTLEQWDRYAPNSTAEAAYRGMKLAEAVRRMIVACDCAKVSILVVP